MPAMYTLAQDVAPPPMRATSAALMIAIVSVAGFGLGPPVIGLASDIIGHMSMQAHGISAEFCARVATAACASAEADGLRLSMGLGSISFRSEEHPSELQSLLRNSYAVFCLPKK